ncbi:MAG TPA: hypothetical protein VM869_32830 [Enhygromyxa sp.]|nr:hypothetical protein [Enhygromyxa sp.]
MSSRPDPAVVEVWVTMAEHYLDTETRHEIPLTAMACVRAGLTVEQARHVWRNEVSPAVSFNAWDPAGEWAGWPREWLIEQIEQVRLRWSERAGPARWILDLIHIDLLQGVRVSIERCMEALREVPSPVEREHVARDMVVLARHYFDFDGPDLATLASARRQRICSLYPEPFARVMSPALASGEESAADRRVRAALVRAV